ncbi:MAG: HAMP domain-containing sensor histidine kinase [Cyanobacteria bacterium J06639_1]
MSSRFYPSLAATLWASDPHPEWVLGAGQLTWQQAVAALYQLWWDAGVEGIEIVGAESGWLAPIFQSPPTSRRHAECEGARESHHAAPQTSHVSTTSQANADGIAIETLAIAPHQWLFTSDLSAKALSRADRAIVPLLPRDPLLAEAFVAIRTTEFAAIVARVERPDTERPGVAFSFDPQTVQRVWSALASRLQEVRPDCVERWQMWDRRLPWVEPSYRLISRFSSWVMMATQSTRSRSEEPHTLPQTLLPAASRDRPRSPKVAISAPTDEVSLSETELLKAIAHEVRTPLATIQTLTRLILRRSDIPDPVRRYLEGIERECNEQSDRFGLFFRATEFDPDRVRLQTTSLVELLEQKLPLWKQQVERRGSTLDLEVPADVPTVVSDPTTLDAVLSGVIDRVARSTPAGSHVTAEVVAAGEQVKLQFRIANPDADLTAAGTEPTPTQALGQLLAFQPETGALSLSIPMTQSLFRALGGYFTVRQQAQRGETLTIFLPRPPQ